MTHIDILLQGEAIPDIQVINLPQSSALALILAEAAKLRGAIDGDGEFLIFVQDEDTPLKPDRPLPSTKPGVPLCLHVHRCLKVKVEVTFNGKTKEVVLAPSRTVGATKTLAAIKLFGMDRHDAGEHVLQIAGTDNRPDADIHIGSLAKHCTVAFDLVPLVRVEG